MRNLFIGLFLLLGACAAAGADGRRMSGIEWRASDINGIPVVSNSRFTLRLGDNQSVSGKAGCNSYSGQYRTMSKMGIRFSGINSTLIGCSPEIMEQERRFLSILNSVAGYSFYSDGGLSLIAPDGRAIRFRR